MDEVHSHVAMTSKTVRPNQKSESKSNAAPKLSSGQLTGPCCGIKDHIETEIYEKESVECTCCELKGYLLQACLKETRDTKPGSLASSLKPDIATSEAPEYDLVVDSGTTDHSVLNKNWFKSLRELNTTVTNPDGGITKVLGTREVEVSAEDVKGCTKPLLSKIALHVVETELI